MSASDCVRAEITAGAVALGEASDAERDVYRRHLSACAACLRALGGEREIERTMQCVADARETERWEPDVRIAWGRDRGARNAWWFGLATVAAAAVIWSGVHAHDAAAVKSEPARVALAHRVPAMPAVHVAVRTGPGHDLVVLHKVATLKRPPLETVSPQRVVKAPSRFVAHVAKASPAHGAPLAVAFADPSKRDERSIGALRTVGTTPPAPQRAEAIAVLPATAPNRDVGPIGGEGAIVPKPPAIAYYENAEGTTAFDVTVDERGLPVKCSVTKSSGYLVLDEAVCRAAMRARYQPRMLNGRAVTSLYHDSITFKASNDDQ
ncbi:MAG: TonB family protein [Candidatus Eremiobacteraeota bacterium]|nr:TonB family protein [Candidatus Eremiobacteraeota bacterium]